MLNASPVHKTCGIKVNHLPQDITRQQVEKLFDSYGRIANVVVKPGAGESYAFVNFHSKSCAQEAAKKMNGKMVGGKIINCKAQGEPERQRSRSSSVGECTVKVTFIPKQTTKSTLSDLFSLGNRNAIQSIKIISSNERYNYAYINYFSQVDAEMAARRLDRSQVDGSEIKVKLQLGQVSQPSSPGIHSSMPRMSSSYPTTSQLLDPRSLQAPSYGRSYSDLSPTVQQEQIVLGQVSQPSSPGIHSSMPRMSSSYPAMSQLLDPRSLQAPSYGRSYSDLSPTVQQKQIVLGQVSQPSSPGIHSSMPRMSSSYPTTSQLLDPRSLQAPSYGRSYSDLSPTVQQKQIVLGQVSQPSSPGIHSSMPRMSSSYPTMSQLLDPRSLQTPSYGRSYSDLSPTVQQKQIVPVQRQFSHPLSKSSHGPTAPSRTVKVSIFGELSSEDIEEVFSRFGKLRDKPIIRGGNPFFAFVNFYSPEAAANSVASLHNSTLKQIKILCRVYVPQPAGPNLESEEVQCSSLIASILHSELHKEELGRLESEHEVKFTPKPSSNCVRVWGGKKQVNAVKVCLRSLMEKIEGDISEQECELPCHSVPLFEQDIAVGEFRKLEASHGVEFRVLRSPPGSTPVELSSFSKEVKKSLNPTQQSGSSGDVPDCSKLGSYLKEKPKTSSILKPKTTWLWQNDSGSGFIPYSTDIATELSSAFAEYPSGRKLLKIDAYVYLIDFSEMTQTNVSSHRSRPIRQAISNSLNIRWFYRNDEKEFTPYTTQQSEEIEQKFQSNSSTLLLIDKNVYTLDFTAMTQSNAVTKKMRKIERRVEIIEEEENLALDVERVLTLKVSGLPESLEPAMKELKETVERATVEKECQLNMESSNGFKARLVKNMNKYFVTTDLVDDCLKLKGMPRYVERVHLLAEQEKISDREQQIRDSMGGVELKLPSHWKPQSQDVYLDRVRHDSDEWKEEVKRIRNTLGGVSIVKLERIQNKWLWERYSFAKKLMSKKNKGQVNEMHLFHGTRRTSPEKVFRSEKGVDFRYSKEGLWGTGSYFAENASYSNNYAYRTIKDGNCVKQMLICKVLTGDHYNAESKTDQTLRQPPLKPIQTHGSFEEERYDSVKGYTNESYVYVVYDHEKMYPAYLVTYCS